MTETKNNKSEVEWLLKLNNSVNLEASSLLKNLPHKTCILINHFTWSDKSWLRRALNMNHILDSRKFACKLDLHVFRLLTETISTQIQASYIKTA